MKFRNLVVALAAILALAVGHATSLSANHALNQPNAPSASSANYLLDSATTGIASGESSASTNYRLSASIGMATANTASESPGYRMCLGAQCPPAFQSVFVPVVIR